MLAGFARLLLLGNRVYDGQGQSHVFPTPKPAIPIVETCPHVYEV